MFYNARWYDPALGRFAQADSIVPPGVQGLDRYAYVNNNPLRYTDPTGHMCREDGKGCEDGGKKESAGCSSRWLISTIKDKYNWNVATEFSEAELNIIYQTGLDIENYVDSLTSGKGKEWMNTFIGGVNIVRWDGPNCQALPFPLFSSETTIKINGAWSTNADPSRWLAHELGHIWDISTSNSTNAAGAVGGTGDDLNLLIGGTITTGFHTMSRYHNIYPASPYIPKEYLYPAGYGYANTSSADYLAETFALSIYHPNVFNTTGLQTSRGWVTFLISAQASLMP